MSAGTVGFRGFGNERALELPDGQIAPVAPTGRGRIRYNANTNQFEGSASGAAYEAFGGLGGGGTTVSDFAALSALDDTTFDQGVNVAVASVRDVFELDKASTLTVDGVTILATSSGSGRWVRRELPSLEWAARATWHINAATGDDENDGGTAGTALATHAELVRRIGRLEIRQFTTVNIDADLTEDIQANWNTIREAAFSVGSVAYVGPITVIRTGTFTAGTQPWVDAPAASRQDGQVVDTGLGGGSWEIGPGQRLVATSGAAADAYTWVARNLSPDTARVGRWFQPNTFAAVAGPSPGDTYEVQQLVTINGSVNVGQNASVGLGDINLENTSPFSEAALDAGGIMVAVQATGCDLRGTSVIIGQTRFAALYGCRIFGRELLLDGGDMFLGGCLMATRLLQAANAFLFTDFSLPVSFQNPAAAGAGAGVNITSPVLDMVGGGGGLLAPGGAISIHDVTAAGATALLLRRGGFFSQTEPFWARDCSMATGINVRSGSTYTYTATADGLPDIDTPSTNDTLIGGASTAFGALPATTAAQLCGIVEEL